MRITIIIILSLLFGTVYCQNDVFEVNPLPFNTSMYNDFGPTYYKNGIVFSSNRMHPFIHNFRDKETGERLYNLYKIEKRDSLKWKLPRILSHKITTPFNEGPASFNTDYTKMIFSKNRISDTSFISNCFIENNNVCLFLSEFIDGNWGKPTALNFIKKAYNYMHPCWVNDTLLYFASDLSGGFGKTDIYQSIFKNGKWSDPENLGADINSDSCELFPFYHINKRLFFSSNRAESFDIFYADQRVMGWNKAIPFTAPMNTSYNDFALICDSTQEKGYFTSDRDGSDDIFWYKMNWPLFNDCDSLQENNYCFTFFETSDYDLDTMPLRYEWNIANIKKVRNMEASHCFSGPGLYTIELNIIDTLTEEVFYNQASYDFEIKDIEQVFINVVDSCQINTPIELDGNKTNLPGFEPDQFYWEFGDGNRILGAQVKHMYVTSGIYTIQLGIKSIPDKNGVIKKACVIKDIVVLESYTPKEFIVDNNSVTSNEPTIENSHEKPDLKEYGQEDDIIEDKIYKVEVARSADQISLEDEYFNAIKEIYSVVENYLSEDSVYSYTVGSEQNILNAYPIFMKAKKIGYIDAEVKSFNIVPDSITVSDTLAKIILNKLLSQWQNIHFEYNEFKIAPESFSMLNKVYNVLNKYETLIIEIAAHTDDVGTTQTNLELSEKRAHSVYEYLVNKGITDTRLKTRGYGKSKPLNSARTERARAENRRVEFIVIETGLD